MANFDEFSGKVVFVTGGAGGLGRDICAAFGENGAKVVVASQNEERGSKVVEKVKAFGGEAYFQKIDVTDFNSVQAAVEGAIKKWGTIDILVNNAGASGGLAYPDFHAITEDWFDNAYKINVKSTFFCTKAVIDMMKKKKYGRIINISSMAGRTPQTEIYAYASQKSAVLSLTRSFAMELASYGVTVNAVCPGIIYTVMWERLVSNLKKFKPREYGHLSNEEIFAAEIKKRIPMNCEQTARDISDAVLYFASDGARCVTAQTLSVDGGASY